MRKSVLARILPLPEALLVEADEFLATHAAALGGARVLQRPLTNYRFHSGNLYQFSEWNSAKAKRMLESLNCILRDLPPRLLQAGISTQAAEILRSPVDIDARRLRLSLGDGWPWESVNVERTAFREAYETSSQGYKLFHLCVLGVAAVLPPKTFYRLRRWYASHDLARWRSAAAEVTPVPSLVVRKVQDS